MVMVMDSTAAMKIIRNTAATVGRAMSATAREMDVVMDSLAKVNVMADTAAKVNAMADTATSATAREMDMVMDTAAKVNAMADTAAKANAMADTATSATAREMVMVMDSPAKVNVIRNKTAIVTIAKNTISDLLLTESPHRTWIKHLLFLKPRIDYYSNFILSLTRPLWLFHSPSCVIGSTLHTNIVFSSSVAYYGTATSVL
jgi:hypothetical protein